MAVKPLNQLTRGAAARRLARARPGDPIGHPPRGCGRRVRDTWKRLVADWPQLDRRDRDVLLDYIDLAHRLEDARKLVDKHGMLDEDGSQTQAMRLLLSLQKSVASARRDLAATTSTRERVPLPAPHATESGLAALKGAVK